MDSLLATFPTEIGWISFYRHHATLQGIVFGHRSREQSRRALSRRLQRDGGYDIDSIPADDVEDELAERICRFAAGEPVEFADVAIDPSHWTAFARRVVVACRRIPWGTVQSYGELAAAAGSPGAARAVGQVMAGNRFPLIVPCHRVVAAGGRLGGFSSPQGVSMKKRLLALESVTASV